MAREPKSETNLQVFRGSRPRLDVFAKNAGTGCCGTGAQVEYDKLAERVRFDNALAHSNPTGANDKFAFPQGDGFAYNSAEIIEHINTHGVGATISVLVIPTYAFVTGVGVHIAAEEPGLTFNLVTRNGLVLPGTGGGGGGEDPARGEVIEVTATDGAEGCAITRTQSEGSFEGFGALGNARFIDIFGRYGQGEFSLEADEIILEVATLPASGVVTGAFELEVSVSYDVIHRAEA